MALPLLVINRLQDIGRLSKFQRHARAHGWRPIRIAAIDGHRKACPFPVWRDLIGTHFWGESLIKPGALACYLSHRRAWEHVVWHRLPMALICEDDTDLIEAPDRLENIAATLQPFDLLFANDRLMGGRSTWRPVSHALADRGRRAPGGDCYLVTLDGARRLLELSAGQKIHCGVDWAMIWNSLAEGEAVPDQEIALLDRMGRRPEKPLVSYALGEPVARLRDGVKSSIGHSVKRPISEMTRLEVLPGREPSELGLHVYDARFVVQDRLLAADDRPFAEQPEILALHRLLHDFPEGEGFLDIAAGTGLNSIAMASLGDARTMAVEADETARRVLWDCAERSKLTGRIGLQSSWVGIDFNSASPTSYQAAQPASAIRIGAHGGLVNVLKALRKMLRRDRPLVLLENTREQSARLAQFLGRLDYLPLMHVTGRTPERELSLYRWCAHPESAPPPSP